MVQEPDDGGRGGGAELVEFVAGEGHDRLPTALNEPCQLGEGLGLLEGLAAEEGQALDVEGDIRRDPLRRHHAAATSPPQMRVEAAGAADGAALDPECRTSTGSFRLGPINEAGDSCGP